MGVVQLGQDRIWWKGGGKVTLPATARVDLAGTQAEDAGSTGVGKSMTRGNATGTYLFEMIQPGCEGTG